MQDNQFSQRVLSWYHQHGRFDLPWQKNPTPYRVWLSEIMLQQTQVNTVIPYYQNFIEAFPTLQTLALAEQDDVLKLWSGLGYYARARNLHKSAKIIFNEYSSKFPETLPELIALPGIGRSTAGAIASLSMNTFAAILDGNVKRVLARFHAVPGWPGLTKIQNVLWDYSERYTPENDHGKYNQAMMDIGATLCTHTKPKCNECPLHNDCSAYKEGSPSNYPHKKPKVKRPTRETHLLILQHAELGVLLEKRPSAGIWGGLWSFPECAILESINEECRTKLGHEASSITHWPAMTHQFSHFELIIRPVIIQVEPITDRVMDCKHQIWYNLSHALPGGVAAPVTALLSAIKQKIFHTPRG
jgi:A/G-specific adenine glycosylase